MARMRLEARLFSVTYRSTTIVVMATFDSGQLASLRSLTEVFGPMCLILEEVKIQTEQVQVRSSIVLQQMEVARQRRQQKLELFRMIKQMRAAGMKVRMRK